MNQVSNMYGGKVRVRVCGICIRDKKLLLVNHKNIGANGDLWIPPGGGLEFGESAEIGLQREFKEECGLDITVEKLLFINEYFREPLHAIELFFRVKVEKGNVITGSDPELEIENQIIKEVKFVTFNEITELPKENKHNILHGKISEKKLLNMFGYFKLWQ